MKFVKILIKLERVYSTMRNFIFFCGLPCSGKSTYIKNNFPNVCDIFNAFKTSEDLTFHDTIYDVINNLPNTTKIIVSADSWKENNKEYNAEHPELIHQESVKVAEETVYDIIANTNKDIILDGGGINRSYNRRIIKRVRELCGGNICVKCIFFDTPIEVCLKRLEERERKIPIDNIYEKNQRLTECVLWYQENCDKFERVNYFTNEYAFIDMDGTLCAYTKGKRDIDGNVDFVNGKMFLNLRPVKHVVDYLTDKYKDSTDKFFILTACPNIIAWREKVAWIKKYMPWVKEENILFVGNKDYKHVFLKHWMIGNKIKKNTVMMMDDNHDTLNKMIKLGVNALHPSDVDCLDDGYTIFG